MLTNAMLVALSGIKSAPAEESGLATAWLDPKDATIHLRGEIDFSNAQTLFEAIEGEMVPDGDLVFDLSRLEFLDCTGLHFIWQLANRMQSEQRRMVMFSPQPIVRRVFEITQFARHPNLTIENARSVNSGRGGEWVRLA